VLRDLKPAMIETIKVLAERYREKFPSTEARLAYASKLAHDAMKHHNDITRHALFEFLSSLNINAMAELKALMWLGRGSDTDFKAALKYAKKSGLNESVMCSKRPLNCRNISSVERQQS
jgi:hypothetical protein